MVFFAILLALQLGAEPMISFLTTVTLLSNPSLLAYNFNHFVKKASTFFAK